MTRWQKKYIEVQFYLWKMFFFLIRIKEKNTLMKCYKRFFSIFPSILEEAPVLPKDIINFKTSNDNSYLDIIDKKQLKNCGEEWNWYNGFYLLSFIKVSKTVFPILRCSKGFQKIQGGGTYFYSSS